MGNCLGAQGFQLFNVRWWDRLADSALWDSGDSSVGRARWYSGIAQWVERDGIVG